VAGRSARRRGALAFRLPLLDKETTRMQANAWAALLRHIPAEQHSKLMLVTGSGVEIAIQTILRVDHEFVAFKGRLAGSQDQGRLFFVSYHNIDYINFSCAVKDEEFHAMFGTLEMPVAPLHGQAMLPMAGQEDFVAQEAATEVVEEPQPEMDPEPEPVPAAKVGPSNRTPLPIKSAILERFRSRGMGSAGSGQGTTPRPPADG
jgi:hypothetical protein